MNQRGYSIIEMVIGLLVLAVLGAAAGHGLIGGVRAFSDNADALHTLGKLRYASERMAREVREVRRDPIDPAAFEIEAMTATTLEFTRSDGTEVTLIASPPLLTMSYDTPGGTWTLVDEVNDMRFAYLQSDGSTPATGNVDVAFVEFDLALTRASRIYPQRTRVALRNQL